MPEIWKELKWRSCPACTHHVAAVFSLLFCAKAGPRWKRAMQWPQSSDLRRHVAPWGIWGLLCQTTFWPTLACTSSQSRRQKCFCFASCSQLVLWHWLERDSSWESFLDGFWLQHRGSGQQQWWPFTSDLRIVTSVLKSHFVISLDVVLLSNDCKCIQAVALSCSCKGSIGSW